MLKSLFSIKRDWDRMQIHCTALAWFKEVKCKRHFLDTKKWHCNWLKACVCVFLKFLGLKYVQDWLLNTTKNGVWQNVLLKLSEGQVDASCTLHFYVQSLENFTTKFLYLHKWNNMGKCSKVWQVKRSLENN